jgi:hypothetical protein
MIEKFERHEIKNKKLIDFKSTSNENPSNQTDNIILITYFENYGIVFEYNELLLNLRRAFKSQIGINCTQDDNTKIGQN